MIRRIISYVLIAASVAVFSVVAADAPRQLASAFLIRHAWNETLDGQEKARAWPWVRSWPVAEITVQRPGKNGMQKMVVMSGNSRDVLAFAPLWHDGSEKPGMPGISLISGDPHTHFDFLKNTGPGDSFDLKMASEKRRHYVIEEVRIVDDNPVVVRDTEKDSVIILSATYPAAEDGMGQPMRLVAIAREKPPEMGVQLAILE